MAKFFRKIRYHLMENNKVGKYLKYAIGEIILVVIGILIALSINNWNERQKDRDEEQLILAQLQREYTSNLEQLDEKILMRTEALLAIQTIMQYIDQPKSIKTEIFYDSFAKIMRDPTFDPIVNDIIGSEKLRLLQNQELVRLLSNWSSEVHQVQELELEYKKFRTDLIIPCANRLGITRNVNYTLWKDGYTPPEALDKKFNYQFNMKSSKKKIDFETILSDTELEGLASMVVTFHQITNLQSQTLRKRILNILNIIEKEMKEHE